MSEKKDYWAETTNSSLFFRTLDTAANEQTMSRGLTVILGHCVASSDDHWHMTTWMHMMGTLRADTADHASFTYSWGLHQYNIIPWLMIVIIVLTSQNRIVSNERLSYSVSGMWLEYQELDWTLHTRIYKINSGCSSRWAVPPIWNGIFR